MHSGKVNISTQYLYVFFATIKERSIPKAHPTMATKMMLPPYTISSSNKVAETIRCFHVLGVLRYFSPKERARFFLFLHSATFRFTILLKPLCCLFGFYVCVSLDVSVFALLVGGKVLFYIISVELMLPWPARCFFVLILYLFFTLFAPLMWHPACVCVCLDATLTQSHIYFTHHKRSFRFLVQSFGRRFFSLNILVFSLSSNKK